MLKPAQREKLQDCQLMLQSASDILSDLEEDVVPHVEDIYKCVHDADRTIARLLRS